MRKMVLMFSILICLLGLSGCSKVDTVLETSGNSYMPVHSTGKGGLDEKGADEQDSWSEQDIMSMFSRTKETNWEYADCVLFPDEASGRIGAVLFWDSEKEASNVAFFDADGDCQQCGVYAKLSGEPEFTYLRDGTVTFKLETEDGTGYNYTITISIDGSRVNFKAEDDLLLMKK